MTDTETIAQLRRDVEANRKGWHDCNQKLAEEYAGHCVTKRALAAEQRAHEHTRKTLSETGRAFQSMEVEAKRHLVESLAANARSERYREALRDLRDVFRRELPRYRLDSLGLEIERALSDEPAPAEVCSVCGKDGPTCSAPTTEEEPKE
jgi:hypothetical protein